MQIPFRRLSCRQGCCCLFERSDTLSEADPAGKEAAMREEYMGQDPVSMETKEI